MGLADDLRLAAPGHGAGKQERIVVRQAETPAVIPAYAPVRGHRQGEPPESRQEPRAVEAATEALLVQVRHLVGESQTTLGARRDSS